MLLDVLLSDAMENELVDGLRCRKVSPKRKHGAVQLTLSAILRRCCGARGKVASEWRCVLESGVDELIPDVAFFSYERLLPLSEDDRDEPPFAPDIAVEVRSPSDNAAVLRRKIDLYLTHGALLVLDVDPQTRTIFAHDRAGSRRLRCGERFSLDEVPWLEFDIAEAFEDLDMPGDA
jgi:Uma2 family endonuclease